MQFLVVEVESAAGVGVVVVRPVDRELARIETVHEADVKINVRGEWLQTDVAEVTGLLCLGHVKKVKKVRL